MVYIYQKGMCVSLFFQTDSNLVFDKFKETIKCMRF